MSEAQGAPARPRTRDEFLAEFLHLARCVDNLLVAHHGLRHSLAADHLPFDTDLGVAMAHYGPGSVLFHLWNECRCVEDLRLAWTGKPTPPRSEV